MAWRLALRCFVVVSALVACGSQGESDPGGSSGSSPDSPSGGAAIDTHDLTHIELAHDHCGAPQCKRGAARVDLLAKRLTIRGCPFSGVPFAADAGLAQAQEVRVDRALTDAEIARVRGALEAIRVGAADHGLDGEMWTLRLFRGDDFLGSHVHPGANCSPGGKTQVVAGFAALRHAVPTE